MGGVSASKGKFVCNHCTEFASGTDVCVSEDFPLIEIK